MEQAPETTEQETSLHLRKSLLALQLFPQMKLLKHITSLLSQWWFLFNSTSESVNHRVSRNKRESAAVWRFIYCKQLIHCEPLTAPDTYRLKWIPIHNKNTATLEVWEASQVRFALPTHPVQNDTTGEGRRVKKPPRNGNGSWSVFFLLEGWNEGADGRESGAPPRSSCELERRGALPDRAPANAPRQRVSATGRQAFTFNYC